MSRQPRGQGASAPSTSRQNEYFVPRDGIDREVISADICRYLGNDALVRPGQYEVRLDFITASDWAVAAPALVAHTRATCSCPLHANPIARANDPILTFERL
jgi:hypothetical protein